jgi:SAM-dependent methyltransferase
MSVAQQFDHQALTYDADLNRALAISGEDKAYFARARVARLKQCLKALHHEPASIIDYGCGIGDTAVLLRDTLGAARVTGLDISIQSLEMARAHYAAPGVQFLGFQDCLPQAACDLVYCNGVFHHIPVKQRNPAVDYIYRSLRPGGLLALWENNPWNPGTRYVMSKCGFDRDAVPLAPPESRHLVCARGFEMVSLDFLFFFPRFLKLLRPLEPHLARLPLGAQYLVLCRKI